MPFTDTRLRQPSKVCLQHKNRTLSLLALCLISTSFIQAQTPPTATPKILLAEDSSSSIANDVSALPEAPQVGASYGASNRIHAAGSASSNSAPASAPADFPTLRQREKHYLSDLLGPTAFLAPAFQAGIDQAHPLSVGYPPDGFIGPGEHPAHGDVPEWGEGADGYAKRYASRFGQGLIATTSRYALGEVLREDVTYHRCQCTGLLPRTGHALAGAYLAHTRTGRTVPSLPAMASPFIASEVAVSAWYPARYNTSDAFRTSAINYIAAPFKNLFAEFLTK